VLAKNLRALLLVHEMTERDLAKASGVSQGQINNILNCRTSCSIETAEALAQVFGLTGWHLLLHGLTDELLSSPTIAKMVDSYIRMNGEGRALLDAMIRREGTRKR
jgi:transcriptional regulator with XRE-family HTH domain